LKLPKDVEDFEMHRQPDHHGYQQEHVRDSQISISPMFIRRRNYHVPRQFSVMLLKPGFKPVLGLFSWNRLPLLLVELAAIRQSLISKGTGMLIHEIAPCRCAACNPSKRVATSMMPSVATRVTTMPAGVATSMPSRMSSSACKYRRRTEEKDYADDYCESPDFRR
jgi:hypothetical protein